MAKSNADLPDPLEHPDGAAPGGTDDLLSQLAGDEIDRLLAEADAQPALHPEPASKTAAPATAAPATPAGPAAPASPAPPPPSEELPDGVDLGPPPTLPGEAPDPLAESKAAFESQLDDLFAALTEPAAAPAPAGASGQGVPPPSAGAAAPAVAAPAVAAPAVAAPAPSAPDAAPAGETPAAQPAVGSAPAGDATPSAAELDAQLARLANELLPAPESEHDLTPVDPTPASPAAAPEPAPAAAATAASVEPAELERSALLAGTLESELPPDGASAPADDAGAPAPWYVRLLLLLNAPFSSLSDPARQLLGKLALATLLFSATLLAYLAFTRHHL